MQKNAVKVKKSLDTKKIKCYNVYYLCAWAFLLRLSATRKGKAQYHREGGTRVVFYLIIYNGRCRKTWLMMQESR